MDNAMERVKQLIDLALREDIGQGDYTTLSCIPENAKGRSQLLVKEPGVLAGVEVAAKVFDAFDPGVKFSVFLPDGSRVQPGDIAFEVEGKVRSLLQCERLALNFMQRMSGIATRTAFYVSLIEGSGARILDTRKTTPNMRILEKMAVKIGGGENHRMGLYDMVMIKDNHVDFAGGIVKAIEQAHNYLRTHNLNIQIEVEVRNMEELQQVLGYGHVNRIMLDNFSIKDLSAAVRLIDKQYETEASGGITEDTIRQVAYTGVDYISVGALTHHVKSLDLSLKAI